MGLTKKRRRRRNSGRRVGRKRFPGKQELELERSISMARQIKEDLAYNPKEIYFPFDVNLSHPEQSSIQEETPYKDYNRARLELLRIYNITKDKLKGKPFSVDFLISEDYTGLANAIKEFHGNKIFNSLILPKIDKTGRANPFYDIVRDSEEDRENFLIAHGIKPGVGKITENHFERYKKPSIKTLESRLQVIREVGLHPADRPWLLLESPSNIKRASEESKRANGSSPYRKLGVAHDVGKTEILDAIIMICAEVSEKYYTKEQLRDLGYRFIDKEGKERHFLVPTTTQLNKDGRGHVPLYLWKHYDGIPKFREYVHENFETNRKEEPEVPPTWEVRRDGKVQLLAKNGVTEDSVSKRLWRDLNRYSLKKLEDGVALIKEFGFDVRDKLWLIDEGDMAHLRDRLEDMKYDLFIRELLKDEYGVEISPNATFVRPIVLTKAKANKEFEREEIDEQIVEKAFIEGLSGNGEFRHVLLAAKRNDNRAIETLLKYYDGKIRNLAFKHYTEAPIEDKISLARMGLLGAIRRFTDSKFNLDDFSAYCYRSMQYEIFNHYKLPKDVRLVSLQKDAYHNDDKDRKSNILLEDTIASYDRFDERLIERDLIEYVSHRLKENLTEQEYNFLIDHYGLGGRESLSSVEMEAKYGYKDKKELSDNLLRLIQKASAIFKEKI